MTAPALPAPDFADRVIQDLHETDPQWWESIAPEHQREARAAYDAAVVALGASEYVRFVHEMDDAFGALVIMAYAAGIRHGVAAEQFRAALTA